MPEKFTGVSTASTDPDWKTLHRIADRNAPAVQRSFAANVARARGGLRGDKIKRALSRGNTRLAWRLANETWEAASAAWRFKLASETTGVILASSEIMSNRIGIRFDVTNPAARQWARRSSGKLIREVNAGQRRVLRRIIGEAFTEKLTSDQTVRRLVNHVGLTERMSLALSNFENSLDAGISPGRRAALVTRQRNRMIRRRARAIARTEMLRASNQGQQVLWQHGIRTGQLVDGFVSREWIVTPDDRLCPICEPMHGQRRGIEEDFQSPTNGAVTAVPPIHPLCRCSMGLVRLRQRLRASA